MRLKGHTAWYKDCGFPWVILTIHDYRTTKDLLVRLNSLLVTTRPSLVYLPLPRAALVSALVTVSHAIVISGYIAVT